MTEVVGVRFRDQGKVYYFAPGDIELHKGSNVIVETSRGEEYGECVTDKQMVEDCVVIQPLRPVVRVATKADTDSYLENRAKEPAALELCQKKILEHGLDMKLVDVEYSFDGSKILFFFTSDGRVDFRELVKNLASVFKTRIELRQIGVRDEAKMLGGIGICGRPFCCTSFLDDFQPVSIKMAKSQSLSLNPVKISGTCGRLMCCLKYEQDAYEDLIKNSPKIDSLVKTSDGRGTVIDVNLLKRQVKVRLDSENDPTAIKVYDNDKIEVLRNGKRAANQTDEEIAEDDVELPVQTDASEETRLTTEAEKEIQIKENKPEPYAEQPKQKQHRQHPRQKKKSERSADAAKSEQAKPTAEQGEAAPQKTDQKKQRRKRRPYSKPADSQNVQSEEKRLQSSREKIKISRDDAPQQSAEKAKNKNNHHRSNARNKNRTHNVKPEKKENE